MAETSEERRPSGAAIAEAEAREASPSDAAEAADAQAPAARKSARPSGSGRPHFPTSSTMDVAAQERVEPRAAYDALGKNARLGDIVALGRRALGHAIEARTVDGLGARAREIADELGVTRADLDTPFGNVLAALESPETQAERALAAALLGHVLAETPRKTPEEEDRLVADALWLAASTPYDALELFDRALGEDAADVWVAVADRVRRFDAGRGGSTTRAEAVLGCVALVGSSSAAAAAQCARIAPALRDPALRRLLETRAEPAGEVRIEGELASPPRGLVWTALLGVTGVLFFIHAASLLARVALAYKRPTEVTLDEAGARVRTKTELLGRTLRESDERVTRADVVRFAREVRYPRLAFYAGLFALALGSWVGVRTLSDGVRAASPSLLLAGLALVVIGIGADFVLGTLLPGARGRCRVTLVSRTGRPICVEGVDRDRADDALRGFSPKG